MLPLLAETMTMDPIIIDFGSFLQTKRSQWPHKIKLMKPTNRQKPLYQRSIRFVNHSKITVYVS